MDFRSYLIFRTFDSGIDPNIDHRTAEHDRIITSWTKLQYNPEITVLKGPANFDLYWRELLLVGDTYDMIFLQFLLHI